MTPHVLVLNPEVPLSKIPDGLTLASWDEFSFWIGPNFSFSSVMSLSGDKDLSAFLLVEARAAFLVSILDLKSDTYLAGMSELSSLLLFLRCQKAIFSTNDFSQHLAEYTQHPYEKPRVQSYSQMVIWDQDPAAHLSHLALHGRLYLASTKKLPEVPSGFCQEMKWAYDEGSEVGPFYLLQLSR